MRTTHASPRRRTAFTMIELLVVVGLIVTITALGIGYVVFSSPHAAAVNGAGQVYGALVNAKGQARRDSLPTGIRILFGTNNQANQLQLVQQPEDYNQDACQGYAAVVPATSPPTFNQQEILFNPVASPPTINNAGFIAGVDFQGSASFMGEIGESTVQAGDYFTSGSPPTPHLITKVFNDAANPGKIALNLASPAPGIQQGTSYSIIRAPRPLPSMDAITLPGNLVIDNRVVGGVTLCKNLPLRTLVDFPPGPIAGDPTPYDGTIARRAPPTFAPGTAPMVAEILFAPSGGVVGQGTGADKVYLWLADSTLPAGDLSALILSVQIRTGMIGTFPAAPGADPYAYAKDPRASGL